MAAFEFELRSGFVMDHRAAAPCVYWGLSEPYNGHMIVIYKL